MQLGVKRLCIAALAIGVAALPQIAAAFALPSVDLIAEFRVLCMAHDADRASALSEAAARRWKPTRPEAYARGGETYLDARVLEDSHGAQLLLVDERVYEASGLSIKARECTVMATVDDPRAIIEFAESLAGSVKPIDQDALGRHWVYAQTESGPKPIITVDFATQAISAGRYRELLVSDQQTGNPGGNTALKLSFGSRP